MKVSFIRLKDFKRFTDLTISGIPDTAKLVVLIGPNGSGKSALFDAFGSWLNLVGVRKAGRDNYDRDYHHKVGSSLPSERGDVLSRIELSFHDCPPPYTSQSPGRASFYFRSSYRHEADFSIAALEKAGDVLEDQRNPGLMISPDARVSDNYRRIVSESIAALYEPGDDDTPKATLREMIIGDVRDSMRRVFGDLLLTGPGKPLEGGTFLFAKGTSRDFRFKNLSGGEKAAFDLLLDFVLKIRYFNNTVYCIDEPELHMHSALQGRLLEEMYGLLPDACQMWIATHSIGVIRKSKELYYAHPERVAFLDFGDKDFDQPVSLTPVTPTRAYWERVLEVAIGDLVNLVAPRRLIVCEGGTLQQHVRHAPGFDARCFEVIFEAQYPDVSFVSLGSVGDVHQQTFVLETVFRKILPGVSVTGVIDRDYRNDTEIADWKRNGFRVLSLRTIESYLWDDEILERFCAQQGRPDAVESILSEKARLLQENRDSRKESDDHKAISERLYQKVRRDLGLTQSGSDAQPFAIQFLAPLITPDTIAYKRLERDIFG